MTDISWNKKRRYIFAECETRGIAVFQQGKAFRLKARGVDIMVTDLSWITLDDLEPRFGPPPPHPKAGPFA